MATGRIGEPTTSPDFHRSEATLGASRPHGATASIQSAGEVTGGNAVITNRKSQWQSETEQGPYNGRCTQAVISKRISNVERRSISLSAILGAAEHLFVTQRFHTTTIDQITERAKLTKGAVYFYSPHKTTLLIKLLERVETQIY